MQYSVPRRPPRPNNQNITGRVELPHLGIPLVAYLDRDSIYPNDLALGSSVLMVLVKTQAMQGTKKVMK